MTLFLIGLGLFDLTDITLRGLEAIKNSDIIYLEHYTSVLHTSKEELEKFFNKPIILADRNLVESKSDEIINSALEKKVAFLVVGDPFGATTHSDIFLRAKETGVLVEIIHNASILSAVGVVGLELYKFGKTTSIVFSDDSWLPQTPYDVIKSNINSGLHTLCLLDIKVSESSKKDLLKGLNNPLPPRFMSVNEGISILLKIEDVRKEGFFTKDTFIIGVARLGASSKEICIKAGKAKDLLSFNFGKPLHSIIVPSNSLHHIEEEMIKEWLIKDDI